MNSAKVNLTKNKFGRVKNSLKLIRPKIYKAENKSDLKYIWPKVNAAENKFG